MTFSCVRHFPGLGNHTQHIFDKASKNDAVWIRVDGPYGNLNINYKRFPVLLMISGGIGITPVMGILKDLYRCGDLADQDKPIAHTVEDVYLVWVVQSQFEWFASEIQGFLSKAGKSGFPKLRILILCTFHVLIIRTFCYAKALA